MVILYSDDTKTKIIGRCILWEVDENTRLMDRVYVENDSDYFLFKKYAVKNGYWRRSHNNKFEANFIDANENVIDKEIKISINHIEYFGYPFLDTMKFYNTKELEHMVEEQIIEIAPLAFCRGRNFKHSWIILDEAQNATPSQMKMLMTRIGEGSKIVITGDVEQTDRKTPENGLLDLTHKIQKYNVPGMKACQFDTKDIRRHEIIEHILNMYS